MNFSLQSYIALTDNFCKLCQAVNRDTFVSDLCELESVITNVIEYNLFPLDVELEYISLLKNDNRDWVGDRNELCRQLYVAIATLMYRFEVSDIRNRAYFDYVLELARTSLPYEITNEWGKEYVQNLNFSHEGFFFALNREFRFLLKNKTEYEAYRKAIRQIHAPSRPIEKSVPVPLWKNLVSIYKRYYDDYCCAIETLYPEIKNLLQNYNMHLRIYLCSYNIDADNPNIDFVLANFYQSTKREVTVYPNYVNFAYRFCNVEDIKDKITGGLLSVYKKGEVVYDFMDISSIHQCANMLFAQNATLEKLRDYVCYFLRGMGKHVTVLENGSIMYDDKTVMFCAEDISFESVETLCKSALKLHLLFVSYPLDSIVSFLKENKILWSCIFRYGQDMINNDNARMVHWFIRDNISELKNLQIDMGGGFLDEKLKGCQTGKLYWHDYELIGAEIFEYLFSDDFQDFQFNIQSSTSDGVLRRDYTVNNNYKNQSSFWARMCNLYHCNMIVVDFKNYSEGVDSNCVYNVTKYMKNCTGQFVVVFSRKGLSDSGRAEQLRLFGEGKLVLCLSDKELEEMIRLRQSGKSPCVVMDRLLFYIMQGA